MSELNYESLYSSQHMHSVWIPFPHTHKEHYTQRSHESLFAHFCSLKNVKKKKKYAFFLSGVGELLLIFFKGNKADLPHALNLTQFL